MKISLSTFLLAIALNLNAQLNTISQRIDNRDFPSIFQAWSKADNLPNDDKEAGIARHDMFLTGSKALKLNFEGEFEGLSVTINENSIKAAQEYKKLLLEKNPNLISIAEIRYRDANKGFLPENSPFWMRDEVSKLVYGWEEGKFIRLELRDTSYQNIIAGKAAAIIKSGAVDGIFLDWWTEDEFVGERLAILKKVRKAIGEDALIILNSNEKIIPKSAPFANGIFMECWDSYEPTAEKWQTYQSTLVWAEKNMREPHINGLESYTNNRQELNKMRATTALSLCVSNGYSLYADNGKLPTPDHMHDWYEFYDAPLGTPLASGFKRADNAYQREFSNGTAIYNPLGNTQVEVTFSKPCKSMSSGLTKTTHSVPAFDGDIFIPLK